MSFTISACDLLQKNGKNFFNIQGAKTQKNSDSGSLFDALKLPTKKISGSDLTPNPDTKGAIPYDTNMAFDAFFDKNAEISNSENDNGYFKYACTYDEENDSLIVHQLADHDFDGVFDSYQFSISHSDGTREFWNDNEFDGKFDLYGKQLSGLLCGLDIDTDGTMDIIENEK